MLFLYVFSLLVLGLGVLFVVDILRGFEGED